MLRPAVDEEVERRVALSQGLAFLLVIAVALIGIVVQAGLRGQPPRRDAPGPGRLSLHFFR
jgi:hypothetical protein